MYNYNFANYPNNVPYYTNEERIPYQFDNPYNIMPYYYSDPGGGHWDGYGGHPFGQQIQQDFETREIQESTTVQRPIIIPDEVSFENREDAPVVLEKSWAEKSPRFRGRCGCQAFEACSSLNRGQSYAAVNYNYGVGPGKYNIKVWIKHYGKEYYGKGSTFAERWRMFQNAPSAYTHFQTSILTGPGDPGRGGYFMNDNNETYGLQTGTLGLEVYDKQTGQHVAGALYYFDGGFGSWGREWLRCGHDYGFMFKDR